MSGEAGVEGSADAAFRDAAHTVETGSTERYAYAVVSTDGRFAIGLLDSGELAATDVTVDLRGTTEPGAVRTDGDVEADPAHDEQTLTVTSDRRGGWWG